MTPASDDKLCRIAFASYRNITVSTAAKFAERGVTPSDFFTLPASALGAITGVRPDFFSEERRARALEAAREERVFVDNHHIETLFCSDSDYPQRLALCGDAPAMLFALGNTAAMNAPRIVSVVGTRHCTAYGADFTRRLVEDLADAVEGLVIVSGLAYGADICAHRAAFAAGVPTGAIVAHGLNTVYPADHRSDAQRIIAEGGFVATEYTSKSVVHKGNFLARNRIVAGIADVTVVVESDMRGGAMSTARMASAYGREVMALPGRVNDTYSRGTNQLIASGTASLIRDAGDLIDLMNWPRRAEEGTQQELVLEIPDEYMPVLEALKSSPESTVNDLCMRLDMPYPQLSSLLFRMELDDFVVALPGGRYVLPAKS